MIDLTGSRGVDGAGPEMPRNEEIGFQLTLTDGGNIELYLYTIQGLDSYPMI